MLRRMFRTSPKTRSARARLTAGLAGLAAGARQTRRGSFLIMVVGTLALLAVVTIVYVSIGRADSQASAAARKNSERDEVPNRMRDYIAGIISADLFDVEYLRERDADGNPVFRREIADYPSSPFQTVLPLSGGSDSSPTYVTAGSGNDARFWFNPTGNFSGTDPWLASSTPSLMAFDPGDYQYESDPTRYWRERMDWMQLSDVAPDGMFVNLFNLRDYGLDATPWQMRERLSLFEESPVAGGRTLAPDYSATDSHDPTDAAARPAEWAARQRWSFFPKVDPVYGPEEAEYLLYQYADADGDGMLDSRWIEMVLARDSDAPEELRWLIAPDERFRYFFAVRIEDLSGRVNVNTATDGTLAPIAESPYGVNPAAVDLRHILTLQDLYTDLRMPSSPNGSEWGYQLLDPTGGAEDYSMYDAAAAFAAGEKGYDALRMVLDVGSMLPVPGLAGLEAYDTGTGVDREFSLAAGGGTLNPYWSTYWKLNGAEFEPVDYYELFAGFGPGGGVGLLGGGTIESGVGRAFGFDTLLDLLAFRGVNDDRFLSPLEVVLSGRANYSDSGSDLVRFSPLRDIRSTTLERDTRFSYVKGKASYDLDALVWSIADIRQFLTTASGDRPLAPTVIAADVNDPTLPDAGAMALTEDDLKRDVDSLFDAADGAAGQVLFETYADAMLPYSDNQTHWQAAAGAPSDTLYYGHRGPHAAIRTAAAMAVNMTDAYDLENIPTKRTLLLNGSQDFRKHAIIGPGGRDPAYPWKLLDLDLDNTTDYPRLSEQQVAGMPDAVNVFGIEAQPFIVEAATFIMYTDTPEAFGGDDDTNEARLNGQRVFRNKPSIDGRVPRLDQLDVDNPDFLFEVLAFQIHNPFDETIDLSGDPDDGGGIDTPRRGQYYIQYGDKYFKLTKDVFDGGTESEIDLGPRDSLTVYVLSQNPDAIASRVFDITGSADYGGRTLDEEKQRVRDWIDRQLGQDAVRIAEFDPVSGRVAVPGPVFVNLQSGSQESRRVVRLWRIERPELDTEQGGFEVRGLDETSTNDPANDTLTDRLRDPESANTGSTIVSLDRRLPSSPDRQGAIENSDNGPEPPDADADDGDNRGLTITRYASLRRHDDPGAAVGSSVPRGGIPAYCIEAKDQSDLGNVTYDDGSAGDELDIADFRGDEGDDTLDDLLDSQSGPGLTKLAPTLTKNPYEKRDDPKNGVSGASMPPNKAGRPFGGDASNPPLYVEPHLDNDEFEVNGISTMRLADLLLPLGIGPHQVPGAADEDSEWTTLGEALAIALAYDDYTTVDSMSVYNGAFYDPTGMVEPLLDTGHARYDAFIPFFDKNHNGQLDRPLERAWGPGVPMVATLFDEFTAMPRKFGSLLSPTYGQININTAPREVARALPGLSPPNLTGPDGSAMWWWTGGVHDWQSDIASTLVAYRDRLNVFTRDIDNTNPPPVNFRDWFDDPTDPQSSARTLPQPGVYPPGYDPAENVRYGATGVAGIREAPGFTSLGELTLVRDLAYIPNGTQLLPHDIDRLGFDALPLDQAGVDSVRYGTDEDDGIDDDFDERLALVNAVASSTTIRSDFFAVWFIVHGYQGSDLQNLGENDPLVPTVARRFVMVVDRSNVTQPGEKPRVVLFKEVPL